MRYSYVFISDIFVVLSVVGLTVQLLSNWYMSETTIWLKTLEDNGDGGEGTGKGSCALRIVLPANLESSLEEVIENYYS